MLMIMPIAADWDAVKANPESIQFPREDWIHSHDAEVHAEAVVGQVLKKFESPSLADTPDDPGRHPTEEVEQPLPQAVSVA